MSALRVVMAVLFALSLSSCGSSVNVSQLAVSEPHVLAKRCKQDEQAVETLSYLKSTQYIRVTFDRNPCAVSGGGFALQDGQGSGELTIIPFAYEGDDRIPANINTMIDQERALGNHVIPIKNPRPGDVRQAISAFAVGHPEVRNADRVNIMMHGHGEAVRSPGQPTPISGPTDTIISDSFSPRNPPNGVELPEFQTPRTSFFSAQDVTRETLGTLQQSGIAGDNTTCNLYVGSCEAGGVIGGMRNDWPAWNRLGLDSAIGGSRANQVSFDIPTQNGPSEGLLGSFYGVRNNPPPGIDNNGDGVVTQGEFRSMLPGVASTQSATVIGSDLGVQGGPQTHTNVTPIGQDPNTGDVYYDHSTTRFQDFDFAGGDNTPLFNVPVSP